MTHASLLFLIISVEAFSPLFHSYTLFFTFLVNNSIKASQYFCNILIFRTLNITSKKSNKIEETFHSRYTERANLHNSLRITARPTKAIYNVNPLLPQCNLIFRKAYTRGALPGLLVTKQASIIRSRGTPAARRIHLRETLTRCGFVINCSCAVAISLARGETRRRRGCVVSSRHP